MTEKDNSAIGLIPEQTGKVVDGLKKKGATFLLGNNYKNGLEGLGQTQNYRYSG
jgi:hypothetical protein